MDMVLYALLNKKIKGVASGVASHRVEGTNLILTFTDGTSSIITFTQPKDGLSAYELAQKDGFIGTEKEWLESLKGETPYINSTNNHWMIGTVDTGITAQGVDGNGIQSISINEKKELICTMTNGTEINAGELPDSGEEVSLAEFNTFSEEKKASRIWYVYDDDEGQNSTLEEALTSNVAIGSITKGKTYAVGTPLEDIIRDILTEKIAPAATLTINPTKTLYDAVTESISSLTINAVVTKKTNDIAKIEYYVDNNLVKTNTTGVANGGTFPYIYNTAIDKTTTIKIVVTDTEGLTTTQTKTITFIGQSYYGLIDAESGEPTEALVKTLNKTLKNTKKYVYSGITTDWAKICYAYPAELGKLTSIMDKVNNFNYTSSFQLTTKTIDGISYYVYTLIEPTGADGVELTFE